MQYVVDIGQCNLLFLHNSVYKKIINEKKIYHKVDAFKRVSLKRLPHVLIIHMKRFAFDYDRNVPVKYNDYFEFPKHLDMQPYTTYGLAKQEQGG